MGSAATLNQKAKPALERIEAAIYRDLRDDIVRLMRAPGERLLLEDLGRYYGTSLTPVRQALRRLEGEGLVETTPGRGSRVAPVSFEELEEILTVRLGVEPLLARLGAERTSDHSIQQMERLIAESEEALLSGDPTACFVARARCRDTCYEAADRPRLLVIARRQRLRTKRYVLSIAGSEDALAGSLGYHEMLVEACRTHDGALAQRSTVQALAAALTAIARILDPERAQDWDWMLSDPATLR